MKFENLSSISKALLLTITVICSTAVSAKPDGVELRLVAVEDRQQILELISRYAWAIDSGAAMEQIETVFAKDAVADYVAVGDHQPMNLNEHLVGIEEIQAWLHEGRAKTAYQGRGARIPVVPGHTFTNAIVDLDGNKANVRFVYVGENRNYTAAYQVGVVKINDKWYFKSLRHEARIKDASFLSPGSKYMPIKDGG